MIKQVYSRRLRRNVYRLDTRLSNGIRFRKFFLKRSDAEAVAYKIKHDASTRRFGLSITLDRPDTVRVGQTIRRRHPECSRANESEASSCRFLETARAGPLR